MELDRIVELFLRMEYEEGLFSLEINGCCLWPYIRHVIFQDILYYKGVVERIPYSYIPEMKHFEDRWRKEKERASARQFSIEEKSILIIPHGRKYRNAKGNYRCIYTDLLIKKLGKEVCVLDYGDVFKGFLPSDYEDVIFQNIEEWMTKSEVRRNDNERLNEEVFDQAIVKVIERIFNIKIPEKTCCRWKKFSWTAIFDRELYKKYYKSILSMVRPKAIVIVCYYSVMMEALCEVAKEYNIPVIELQHGEINNYVIDYNFLNLSNPIFFPDYIFLWGDMEKAARFPIPERNAFCVGFPELENCIKPKYEEDIDKRILFVSSMQLELAYCARTLAKAFRGEGYKIIYKLHPLEINRWQQLYTGVLDEEGIEIIDNMEITIHDCLNECGWVIGSISSALYEATMFPVKIAVMKIGEYEYLSPIYNNGKAILVSNSEELIRVIEDGSYIPDCKIDFFKKNSLNTMVKEIKRIAYEK